MVADQSTGAFKVDGDRDHLALSGDLVFATARSALTQLDARLSNGASIVADLGGLSRSDSAGLAVLVEWSARARRRGIPLRLVNAGSGLRALARLADLEADLFD